MHHLRVSSGPDTDVDRYIELNPVRANMVEHPGEYLWSSYRTNAQGEPSTLLIQHPLYTALSKDEKTRQAVYRELFRDQLDPEMIDEIRVATNSNYALGSPRFQAQVAVVLGRRVTPGESGRPWKRKQLDSRDLFGKE
jgi:putative transposase